MEAQLKGALNRIQELEEENKKLREQLVELSAEKIEIEKNWEDESSIYTEIAHENKFLKKRVVDLEQSYETIKEELKRVKAIYEVNDLEGFMNLYACVAERCDIKVIQRKYFETTGIKYSQAIIKLELEKIGYQVNHSKGNSNYYASKTTNGYLYIVQLKKHEGTDIYKIGRTADMRNRLRTYKQHDGGAIEIVCNPVSNQFKAEAKLLQLLNDAVYNNELKKDETGDEYYEGPIDVIMYYYNHVIHEYKA